MGSAATGVAYDLPVIAVARIVPLTAVQFYVQPAAAMIALLPLAYTMWRYPNAIRAERG